MLFKNRYFFCSCFHLFLESRTSIHASTAYFLSWMPFWYILLLFMRSYNCSYTRRNFDWEHLQIYSFSIVVRLLKSQIWSKLVGFRSSCWTVLSTSSIWQQHLSVHSCKRRTRTRMRKVRKQANVHSTIILPATFLFCPSRYTCGFSCVFGCDTAFVVAHTHVLWLAVHCKI